MNTESSTTLDGNAAAGELAEIFAFDITSAVGECAACGKTGHLAETYVYADAPGIVVRCTRCQNALIRVVKSSACTWLDMRGLNYVQTTQQ